MYMIILYFVKTKVFFYTALQKAGKHMEDSVVAAYVALLLGCILQENEVSTERVSFLILTKQIDYDTS